MRVAMLAPIAQPIPPRTGYGPREQVVSLLTEGLVSRGLHVTLFATGDSQTTGQLVGVCPRGYEEDPSMEPLVWEPLHISEAFERAEQFDLIHSHLDHLPLTYTPMANTPVVTTIHGCPSPETLPAYRKYGTRAYYVAVSEANKHPELDYIATVHHGVDVHRYTFRPEHGEYLLFFDRIHPDAGAEECIEVARRTGMKLILAGIVRDHEYFAGHIRPHLDDDHIVHVANAGPEERDALLGGAYALLHPVDGDELVGFSAMEAMACGTPAIALKRGSMPEIIADGITGFLVRDADEMTEAVARVRQLDRLQCRGWVEEHFSADRMVGDYIRVYEQIVRQTKREDHRPWGFYEVLADAADHKVKRITVYPGQRLSYQRHFRRSEHWYVLSGRAVVTKDGEDIELKAGRAVDLPLKTWHRVRNPGAENMVFVEVQTGDYFGEDDIERSEDDYGRA